MTATSPSMCTRSTASLMAGEYPPPIDMVTTAGLISDRETCSRTHSKPRSTWSVMPHPSQLNTRTACTVAQRAAP
jgi:hypothetical protein